MNNSQDKSNVAVSIVNYGTSGLIVDALPVLLEDLQGFADYRVAVVDNESPNDDVAALEAFQNQSGDEKLKIVRAGRNGGFAAGNNAAFQSLKADGFEPDYVLMLNPDAVVRPGAIANMIDVMDADPSIGVVGARLENGDGTSWVAAFHFPSAMSEFARGLGLGFVQRRFPVLVSDMVKPGPVDWVSGAAMLTRWAAIEDLGGMDEDYFLYYEEIDFMKAVADAGWSTWHAPDARVLHIAGSSTGIVDGMPTDGRMPPYWFASWRRYFVKNHGTTYASIAAVMKIAGLVLGNIQSTIRGKGKKLPPKFLSDFIQAGLFGRTVAK